MCYTVFAINRNHPLPKARVRMRARKERSNRTMKQWKRMLSVMLMGLMMASALAPALASSLDGDYSAEKLSFSPGNTTIKSNKISNTRSLAENLSLYNGYSDSGAAGNPAVAENVVFVNTDYFGVANVESLKGDTSQDKPSLVPARIIQKGGNALEAGQTSVNASEDAVTNVSFGGNTTETRIETREDKKYDDATSAKTGETENGLVTVDTVGGAAGTSEVDVKSILSTLGITLEQLFAYASTSGYDSLGMASNLLSRGITASVLADGLDILAANDISLGDYLSTEGLFTNEAAMAMAVELNQTPDGGVVPQAQINDRLYTFNGIVAQANGNLLLFGDPITSQGAEQQFGVVTMNELGEQSFFSPVSSTPLGLTEGAMVRGGKVLINDGGEVKVCEINKDGVVTITRDVESSDAELLEKYKNAGYESGIPAHGEKKISELTEETQDDGTRIFKYVQQDKNGQVLQQITYTWSPACTECTAIKNDISGKTTEEDAEITTLDDPAPTCTKGGTRYFIATFADASIPSSTVSQELSALDHLWQTTLTQGDTTHYYACERGCGAKKDEEAHAYANWRDNGDGTHTGTCVCGKTLTEAHSGGEATCTAKAVCAVCQAEYGDALDHDWGPWQVTTEPTCTEEGEETRTCKREGCGETETRPVDCADHPWADTYSWDEETHYILCTQCGDKDYSEPHDYKWRNNGDGTHTGECYICGKTVTGSHTGSGAACDLCGASLGPGEHEHVWGPWKVTTEPTCTETGLETRECQVDGCNETETRPVDALGHLWDDTLTWGVSTHYYVCARNCGAKKDEAEHTYGDWQDQGDGTHISECVCGVFLSAPHSGGTATCQAKAQCAACGAEYGALGGHDWDTSTWITDESKHWHKCKNEGCTAKTDEAEHSGGTATYQAKAQCEVCGAEYGALGGHDWDTSVWITDESKHWHKCKTEGCTEITDEAAHSGGTATCQAKAQCEVCGAEYGQKADHVWEEIWTIGDGKHWHKCSTPGCTATAEEADHSGGTATCQAKAQCEACGAEYGALGGHDWDTSVWITDESKHWHKCKTEGCTEKTDEADHVYGNWTDNGIGGHVGSCVCGATKTEEHSGGTATCHAKAQCAACGVEYGEKDATNHDGGTKKVYYNEGAAGYEYNIVCLGCGEKTGETGVTPYDDPTYDPSTAEWEVAVGPGA